MLKFATIALCFLSATAFQAQPSNTILHDWVLQVIGNEPIMPIRAGSGMATKGDEKTKKIVGLKESDKKTVKSTKLTGNETAIELSTNNFKKNKGKMELPLLGTVVKHFGKHQHPDLQRVMIHNSGIDIRLKSVKDLNVKAVGEGTVSGVQFLAGQNNVLILKHGHYYTVYSGLGTVTVQKDEKIKIGQSLGKVATVKGVSELHFEIWQDKSPTNPEEWLRN